MFIITMVYLNKIMWSEGHAVSELEFLRNVLGLQQEDLLSDTLTVCQIKAVSKGHKLFKRDEKPAQICLLVEGIFRGFFLDSEGNEITDCLVATPGYSLMPDSDLTVASNLTIEALMDACVFSLSMHDFFILAQRYPAVQELYQKMLLYSFGYHRQLKVMMYQYSAAERYRWFLHYYPHVLDQISHKYVASFLNMTPVTLSKLINNASLSEESSNLLDLFCFPDIKSTL